MYSQSKVHNVKHVDVGVCVGSDSVCGGCWICIKCQCRFRTLSSPSVTQPHLFSLMEAHSDKKKKMLQIRPPLFAFNRNRGNYHRTIIEHSIVLCSCFVELNLLLPSECVPQITGPLIVKANVLLVILCLVLVLATYLWQLLQNPAKPFKANFIRRVVNKIVTLVATILFQRQGNKGMSSVSKCQWRVNPRASSHAHHHSATEAKAFSQIFTQQGDKDKPQQTDHKGNNIEVFETPNVNMPNSRNNKDSHNSSRRSSRSL